MMNLKPFIIGVILGVLITSTIVLSLCSNDSTGTYSSVHVEAGYPQYVRGLATQWAYVWWGLDVTAWKDWTVYYSEFFIIDPQISSIEIYPPTSSPAKYNIGIELKTYIPYYAPSPDADAAVTATRYGCIK